MTFTEGGPGKSLTEVILRLRYEESDQDKNAISKQEQTSQGKKCPDLLRNQMKTSESVGVWFKVGLER